MIKIAITGPESTGKTTLAKALAGHYNVEWAREYAREYLAAKHGDYVLQDLDSIAVGQKNNIEALLSSPILIADTEMTVIKIWSEFKYGECSSFIHTLWKEQDFDLYILCSPDIPYEADPLREHEAFREELFEIYHNVLRQMNVNFIVVRGDRENRLDAAVEQINALLEVKFRS